MNRPFLEYSAPITDEGLAIQRLRALAQTDALPKVSIDDLLPILWRHQRASLWNTPRVYAVGQRVQVLHTPLFAWGWPAWAPRHGVYYRCLQAGTTGTTEPNWFELAAFAPNLAGLTDGGILWRYDGEAMPDLWDINAAVHDIWILKAGKVAGKFDVSSDQQSMKRSQIYDHCIKMANRFAPVYIV